MMGDWEDMGDFPNSMRAMSKDGSIALELGSSDGSWWWGLYAGRQRHILVGGDCPKEVTDQDEAKIYAQRAAAAYFKTLAEEFSP